MSAALGNAPPSAATAAPSSYTSGRPHPAVVVWLAAALSLLLVLALFAAGKGTLLRIAIPAGATLTGLALYLRRPIGYVHFTLWTWFLTPLVRRLVDYRVGFADQNLVLLAPFLVSAIAGLTLLRARRNAGPVKLAPFYLCMAGIFYGFAVGALRLLVGAGEKASPGELVYGLFVWLAPLLFGMHLYLRWPVYEEHKRAIQKTFVWAVLILGLYGIYQYVSPPPWDRFWLENVEYNSLNPNFGQPEPFAIRVWSTVNAPGPAAGVLMTGLLLLLIDNSRLRLFAAGAGYLAFALTLVRTAWLGWFLAAAMIFRSIRSKFMLRALLLLICATLLCLPFLGTPAFQTVADRFTTLNDLHHDGSAQVRQEMYAHLFDRIAHEPFGLGLTMSEEIDGYALDSSYLQMAFAFGWFGTLLYCAGIASLAFPILRSVDKTDGFTVVLRAILLSFLLQSFAGNNFTGMAGALFWLLGGMALVRTRPAWQEKVAAQPEPLLYQVIHG